MRAVDRKPGAKSGLEARRWQGRMTLGSMRSGGLKSCGISTSELRSAGVGNQEQRLLQWWFLVLTCLGAGMSCEVHGTKREKSGWLKQISPHMVGVC